MVALCQRVIAKSNAFIWLSGYVIGQWQMVEDRSDACTTVEEIEATVADVMLPDISAQYLVCGRMLIKERNCFASCFLF